MKKEIKINDLDQFVNLLDKVSRIGGPKFGYAVRKNKGLLDSQKKRVENFKNNLSVELMAEFNPKKEDTFDPGGVQQKIMDFQKNEMESLYEKHSKYIVEETVAPKKAGGEPTTKKVEHFLKHGDQFQVHPDNMEAFNKEAKKKNDAHDKKLKKDHPAEMAFLEKFSETMVKKSNEVVSIDFHVVEIDHLPENAHAEFQETYSFMIK